MVLGTLSLPLTINISGNIIDNQVISYHCPPHLLLVAMIMRLFVALGEGVLQSWCVE